MDIYVWLTFVGAAIGLSITPGPNGLLALTHGALHGHKRTLFTILGSALGFMILFAISMAGLGVVLQASPVALTTLKIVGGLYLIGLGVQIWRSPTIDFRVMENSTEQGAYRLFRQGMMVALSNPKVILFLGVFLSMFIDTQSPMMPQFFVMAFTFAVIEFAVEYGVAVMAFKARPWLVRKGESFNRFCAALFVSLGIVLPFAQ